MKKYGTVLIEPEDIVVGRHNVFNVKYIVGERTLSIGSVLRIGIMGRFCTKDLQSKSPEKENYISAYSSKNNVKLTIRDNDIRNSTQYWEVNVRILEGLLKQGDDLIVTFGDRDKGGPGFNTLRHFQKLRLVVQVDYEGKGSFINLPDIPQLICRADKAHAFKIIAPTTLHQLRKKGITIKVIDKYKNLLHSFSGKGVLELILENQIICLEEIKFYKPLINHVFNQNTMAVIEEKISKEKPGCIRLRLREENSTLINISNPVCCDEKKDRNYYWGEIHGHTLLSDGQLTPDEALTGARKIEALDFAAICDHDTHMMRREIGGDDRYLLSPFWREPLAPWNIIKYVTENYNQPGSFITLLGYEWTSGHIFTPRDKRYGHRNVYFLDNDAPLLSHIEPETDTPEKLADALKNKDAIIIPHHTTRPVHCDNEGVGFMSSGTDWDHHVPDTERLVEICSKWGTSEIWNEGNPIFGAEPEGQVINALQRGCRVGFTGGSDTHVSHPGSMVIEEGALLNYRSGLTCVLADELTRGAVFQSLYERRCYATTGERIFLDFSIEGREMGSEVYVYKAAERDRLFNSRQIKFSASGIGPYKIEIIRNGQVIYTALSSTFIDQVFEDRDELSGIALKSDFYAEDFVYYYLRYIQDDGEMAWASPIWFIL